MKTTYDICKWIRKAVLTHCAEVMCYSTWSANFAQQQIRKLPSELEKAKDFKLVDPSDLTQEEMEDLGFGMWSDKTKMMLIPLWLKPFLVEKIQAGCINDTEIKEYETITMDDDHRFGCIAYGCIPKEKDV